MRKHCIYHTSQRQCTRGFTRVHAAGLLTLCCVVGMHAASAQETIALERTFDGHTAWVESVAFSPDGTQVLTGSQDLTAKLWNASTAAEIHTFAGHTDWVVSVAFSPDGTQVLTGSWDNTAKLWSVSSGSLLRTFAGHTASVEAVAFSPGGSQVLTGSFDSTAKLWNVSTGTEIRTFEDDLFYTVTSVAFSPNGTQVLTGSADTTAKLWNKATGDIIRTFDGHTDWVILATFSPDGSQVLTGSWDDTAKLWNTATGSLLRTFTGNMTAIMSAAFSPDGNYVLAGGGDFMAKLWETATGAEIRNFSGHDFGVSSVAFSPDGSYVLTGSADSTARLFPSDLSPSEVELPASLDGRITDVFGNSITCATVVATNDFAEEFLVTVDLDGEYVFQELPAGTYTLEVFASHYTTSQVNNLNLNPDANVTRDLVLSSGSTEGLIRGVVTDIETDQALGGARVEVFDGSTLVGLSFSCADGSYEVAPILTSGKQSHALTAGFSARGYDTFTEQVMLDPGEVVQVSAGLQFNLAVKGQLSGTVRDSVGSLFGARVTANLDNQISRSTTTDILGGYDLLNLELGTYEVTASIQGLESETKRVDVLVADIVAPADFELGSGGPPLISISCSAYSGSAPRSGLAGDIMLLAMVLLLLGLRRRAPRSHP